MHNHHNRQVQVKKKDLIEKIEANRDAHEKDYVQAVEDYKKEAARQLRDLGRKLKKGDMNLSFFLTTPVNRVEDYNKVIEMFKWETKDEVTLDQREFNEYIHDETSWAIAAKTSNSLYRSKSK